ncbi:hypothetical protein L6452_30373 [Arctium lappa]|uniref:Uncharacterized protein n=1 Tax=Arctium lappa TaxID=4217 RepID=A0ACB8ZIH2_ARCLA|nr:hypothetical protein L6452_30373 [Arctium lappa]
MCHVRFCISKGYFVILPLLCRSTFGYIEVLCIWLLHDNAHLMIEPKSIYLLIYISYSKRINMIFDLLIKYYY